MLNAVLEAGATDPNLIKHALTVDLKNMGFFVAATEPPHDKDWTEATLCLLDAQCLPTNIKLRISCEWEGHSRDFMNSPWKVLSTEGFPEQLDLTNHTLNPRKTNWCQTWKEVPNRDRSISPYAEIKYLSLGEEEIDLTQTDFSHLKIGDVVTIYHSPHDKKAMDRDESFDKNRLLPGTVCNVSQTAIYVAYLGLPYTRFELDGHGFLSNDRIVKLKA